MNLTLIFVVLVGSQIVVIAAEPDWWQHAIFYQIYPRSFKDSDNDGVGDLRGITSKLYHLKESGIDATWLSPIFRSPMFDFGYDISDFYSIQPEYGDMDDFENLVREANRLGIKIILDFVPNHSSTRCEWFLKSVYRHEGYEDFYIWHDGTVDKKGVRSPPNNWQSVFYGSAWTWNEIREQYYFHQFTAEQPDLNYRNPRVIVQMENVLKFWLSKGVDGFRVDAVNHLFEDELLRDEPLSGKTNDPKDYEYTHHYYTKDLPESVRMIYSWRALLDTWKVDHGGTTKILMTEAYANITETVEYYGNEQQNGAQIPFNFLLITNLNENSDARDFLITIQTWLSYMPHGRVPNWVLGNHDRPRVGTRFGVERIDGMNILLMTLPGIAVTYNGEEIGMIDNNHITWEQTKDPAARNKGPEHFQQYSRDPVRTPFQWDGTRNGGFSNANSTWLPVHPNHNQLNLVNQVVWPKSHYKLYQQLAKLRRHPTMQTGHFHPIVLNRNVLAYSRELEEDDKFIIVINFGAVTRVVNLNVFDLPDQLIVAAASTKSGFQQGTILETKSITLAPYAAVVMEPLLRASLHEQLVYGISEALHIETGTLTLVAKAMTFGVFVYMLKTMGWRGRQK